MLKMISTRHSSGRRYLGRLVVKSAGTTGFIRVVEIDWIEGAGVYVNVPVARKELLYRAAFNELAENLDPMRFFRFHRSAIVNIDSVVELQCCRASADFRWRVRSCAKGRSPLPGQPDLPRPARREIGTVFIRDNLSAHLIGPEGCGYEVCQS